jgi:hypothetical protein
MGKPADGNDRGIRNWKLKVKHEKGSIEEKSRAPDQVRTGSARLYKGQQQCRKNAQD